MLAIALRTWWHGGSRDTIHFTPFPVRQKCLEPEPLLGAQVGEAQAWKVPSMHREITVFSSVLIWGGKSQVA